MVLSTLTKPEQSLLRTAMELETRSLLQLSPTIKWVLVGDVVAPVCTSCLNGEHMSFGDDHRSGVKGYQGCKNSEGRIQCNCSPDWPELYDNLESLPVYNTFEEAKGHLNG